MSEGTESHKEALYNFQTCHEYNKHLKLFCQNTCHHDHTTNYRHDSNPELRRPRDQILIRGLPEVILDDRITRNAEINQTGSSSAVLWPSDQGRRRPTRVGVEVVDEVDVIRLNGDRWDLRWAQQAVCEQDVRGVERAEYGCAVEICG